MQTRPPSTRQRMGSLKKRRSHSSWVVQRTVLSATSGATGKHAAQNRHASALSARELSHRARVDRQAAGGHRLPLAGEEALERLAGQARVRKADVCRCREVLAEAVLLERHAQPHVRATRHLARVGTLKPCEQPQQRGLSRAGAPHEHMRAQRLKACGHALEDAQLSIVLLDVTEGEREIAARCAAGAHGLASHLPMAQPMARVTSASSTTDTTMTASVQAKRSGVSR